MGKRKEQAWHGDDYEDDDEPEAKRARDATDKIVQAALKQEEMEKKHKKGGDQEGPGDHKGKTLAEIEQEEGGPVKESLIGMAQVKRAENRKKDGTQGMEDTDIPTDVNKFEEDAEVEEEEGVKFTAFNLKEERETGYFDDEGNYVFKNDKEAGPEDAWFASDESKVVSDEVRKMIEERRKKAEEQEDKRQAPLTDRQIAVLKNELVNHMNRGETLAKAMKRLGGGHSAKPLTKREKARQEQQAGESKATGAEGAAAVFARITEIAAQLVDEGEMDVYDSTREDFASFAAMWLPKQPAAGAGAGVGAAAAKASVEDDDDDMFAEEDSKPAAAKQDSAAEGVITGQAGDSGVMTAAGTAESSEFSSWPVKELKRYLQEHGLNPDSFVEKQDMVARAQELSLKGPAVADGAAAPGPYPAPPGYVFDPTSGYFHSSETHMYFDSKSGGYFINGQWLSKDPVCGKFVPWK